METEHHAIKLEHKTPQQQQQQRTNSSSSPVRSSASSSPSHEFSFAISLHSAATTTTPSKIKQQPLAIDLSPADDIFFHGHLLPLHFLSHLHSSPRRLSTHSSDNFPLPLPDFSLRQDDHPLENNTNSSINCASEDDYCISFNKDYTITQQTSINIDDKGIIKSKSSFSLFGLSKWKKGSSEKPEESTNKTKKVRFEMMSQFVKKYIKMVKPLLSGGRRESYRGRKQSYSFSGTVSPRAYAEGIRGRRGDFSAPASMRTSPTNSGLLSATVGAPSPVSDSTMEELQAAIQAAIAHCKNSSISSVVQDNTNASNELQSNELSSIPVN